MHLGIRSNLSSGGEAGEAKYPTIGATTTTTAFDVNITVDDCLFLNSSFSSQVMLTL